MVSKVAIRGAQTLSLTTESQIWKRYTATWSAESLLIILSLLPGNAAAKPFRRPGALDRSPQAFFGLISWPVEPISRPRSSRTESGKMTVRVCDSSRPRWLPAQDGCDLRMPDGAGLARRAPAAIMASQGSCSAKNEPRPSVHSGVRIFLLARIWISGRVPLRCLPVTGLAVKRILE